MPSSEYDMLFKMIVLQTDTIRGLSHIVDDLQKSMKEMQGSIGQVPLTMTPEALERDKSSASVDDYAPYPLQQQINDMQEQIKDVVALLHTRMLETSVDQIKIVTRLNKDINILRERLRNKD